MASVHRSAPNVLAPTAQRFNVCRSLHDQRYTTLASIDHYTTMAAWSSHDEHEKGNDCRWASGLKAFVVVSFEVNTGIRRARDGCAPHGHNVGPAPMRAMAAIP